MLSEKFRIENMSLNAERMDARREGIQEGERKYEIAGIAATCRDIGAEQIIKINRKNMQVSP